MKKMIIILVVLAVLGSAGGWFYYNADSRSPGFRTVQVERGELLATINATGTIEPEEVIDVGAQVAGQILSFGKDPRGNGKIIDYGSPVEKDTVLARIDESLYQALVDRAKAQVDQTQAAVESAKAQVVQAEANVQRAQADLGQMQAKLYQTDRDLKRAKELYPAQGIAVADYDAADAAYKTAKATLAVGEATVNQTKAALKDAQANVPKAEAAVRDAQAALKNAEINLGYCTIKSPVKGVIVDRRVNTGQTVVASLNTPSPFLIAKDLKRLQVWASVNEADIGSIHFGQPVTFTVDAHPGRTFKGTVAADQPRLNASMTQNVVTYTVVVTTDNSDGALVPYLTANLQFEVNKHSDALMVPNSALRWKPNPEQVAPEARDDYARSQQRLAKAPPGEKPATAPTEKEPHSKGTLWVEDGGFVKPIKVKTGLTDGLNTEIVGGDIEQGRAVVVGENRASDAAGGVSNPFTPKMFGGKKPNSQ
ncbi:MAG: HlyD family secretion protein [Gemmataceae bacterium]